MMNKEERSHQAFLILMICTMWFLAKPWPACALTVKEVMVTDVAPASFCVVWLADEPASYDIELFQDQDGLYPVLSHNIMKTPCQDEGIFAQAAANGVLKIKVDGLAKNTTYYFRLTCSPASSPDQTVIYPEDNSLMEVITEDEARLDQGEGIYKARLNSNLMMVDSYLEDKVTPAEGSLVVARIDGASYPISAYVGEGAISPSCILDLYNLFDHTQHRTMAPVGGNKITIFSYKGVEQTAIRTFSLPLAFPEAEPIAPVARVQEIVLSSGMNYFFFQVDPQNSPEIHAALEGKYTELWTFVKGAWLDLTNDHSFLFHPNQGYLVTTTQQVNISAVGGWRVDPIPLDKGLNIVGYRSEIPVPVEEAMAPLVGKYTCIWGYSDGEWRSYDPRLPVVINNLTEIVPGKSYYLEVKETGVRW